VTSLDESVRELAVTIDDPDRPVGPRVPVRGLPLGRLYYVRVAGTIDDGYGGFVLAAAVGRALGGGVVFRGLDGGDRVVLRPEDEVIALPEEG
jgi:hypothetical protein